MSEQKKLKAHLEFGEAKVDFEGDVNQVFEATVRFLTQIYPNLEILDRIAFTPDLTRLAEKLIGLVEITPEGPILVSNLKVSAKEAICLALLGANVGNRLGKLPKETLSSADLSKLTGKAGKTISNEMPQLASEGLVERTAEGEYRITVLGIKRTEEKIDEYELK
jgi:hypothetical protein